MRLLTPLGAELRRHLLVFLLASGVTALPIAARADSSIDGIEHIFGATHVTAITGHGRLSVGVAPDGTISVLTWPSPSYADQIAYVTSNAEDARALERFGAPEEAGIVLGLRVTTSGGEETVFFRDASTFTVEQGYGEDEGPNVHTRHRSDRLGLTVEVIDAVDPSADRMVRRVRVERDAGSPVSAASLLTYANLSPVPATSRVPELPVVDWVMDGRNDFAALWDASRNAVIHFHPSDERIYRELLDLVSGPSVDFGSIGEALLAGTPTPSEVRALVAALDAEHGAGAYLALTTSPAPTEHQVGYDSLAVCDTLDAIGDNLLTLPERMPGLEIPFDPALLDSLRCPADRSAPKDELLFAHTATDPWQDLEDGALEGSDIAAGEVAEALVTPLPFDADGVGTAAVHLAAAPSAASLLDLLDEAKPADTIIDDAVTAADTFVAGLNLPTASTAIENVATRSLLNLRVGTDAETGAIVASIARQPPYGLDWPRDGAFFNLALDVSGQHALVSRRAALYAEWQRDEPVVPTLIIDPEAPARPDGSRPGTYPADAWEMNYYADGEVGGLFRFEIDNTAFAIWSMIAHVGHLPEAEREPYLRSVWPSVRRGANLLAEWRDAETGLHFPAQEDDHAAYTQTLNGAVPVFGALDIAARGAAFLDEGEDRRRWEERAAELQEAILTHLHDEESGRFVREVGGLARPEDRGPLGTTGWLVYPMTLLPWDDARIESQLRSDLSFVRPMIALETEGGQYFMKNTVAFGLTLGQEDETADMIGQMVDDLTTHATPGTFHFGEAMVVVGEGAERRADQRVANPHLWEGALFYLTAMAKERPELLLAHERVLPASRLRRDASGCAAVPASPRKETSGGPVACVLALCFAAACVHLGVGGWRRRRRAQSR